MLSKAWAKIDLGELQVQIVGLSRIHKFLGSQRSSSYWSQKIKTIGTVICNSNIFFLSVLDYAVERNWKGPTPESTPL